MDGSESTPAGWGAAAPRLVPGASVGGGRYRLLAPHGGTRGFQFWHAFDSTLEREVALTIVPAASDTDPNSTHRDAGVLARTLRLGRVDSAGLARVLDVVEGVDVGGLVVAEWTPGRSLREIAEVNPSPAAAEHALRALAVAAELAHRRQSALSIDHPDRIRIDTAGNAVLAFPATPADADPNADVQGLGAVLYALLTGTWALGGPATVGGLPPSRRGRNGSLVTPHTIRREVSYPISTLAVRALDTGPDRIRTAATVINVLDQSTVPESTAPQVGPRPRAVAPLPVADSRKLGKVPMPAAFAGVLVVIALIAWWAISTVTGGETNTGVPETTDAATTSVSAPAVPPPPPALVIVPCDPGYHHDPAPGGPCSANTPAPVETPYEQSVPQPVTPPTTHRRTRPVPPPAPRAVQCGPGYHHDPAPDGPCNPDSGPAAPAPPLLPLPLPPLLPPPPAQVPPLPAIPQQLPCFPGYHHDPAHGGQCWA